MKRETRKKPFDSWVLMCPDSQRAKENRQRIKEGYALDYWLWLERVLKNTPWNRPLPAGVPIAEELHPRPERHLTDLEDDVV